MGNIWKTFTDLIKVMVPLDKFLKSCIEAHCHYLRQENSVNVI